ncbi:MAG: extracellular solute-binding protein [Anaerolineae bacterium]
MLRRLLLSAALLLFLAGCVPPPPSTAEPEILVLWHTFTTTSERNALQILGDHFNATHPEGATLIVEYQGNILEKLEGLPVDQRPDLVVTDARTASRFGDLAVALTLPTSLQRDMLPMATSAYATEEEGELYALPLGLATYVLYYNQVWVRELGYRPESITPEDLLNIACAATDMEGGQIGLGIPAKPEVLLSLLAAGTVSLNNGEGGYTLEGDGAMSAAELGHALLTQGCARIYEFLDLGVEQFADSSTAALIASSLREPEIVQTVLEKRNFTTGITTLPPLTENGGTLWWSRALLLLAPAGPRREAAREVALWTLSPKAQHVWGERTNFLPVRRSLIEEERTGQQLRASRAALLALTLQAAEQGTWMTWSPVTDDPQCRTALVRAIFDLNTAQPVKEVLTAVQATCDSAQEASP